MLRDQIDFQDADLLLVKFGNCKISFLSALWVSIRLNQFLEVLCDLVRQKRCAGYSENWLKMRLLVEAHTPKSDYTHDTC